MNPEFPPNNPRAELEARLTAFILGELPAHDAAALRQAMDEDVELAALYERLKTASKLVREASASPIEQTKEPPAPLRLSEERRQKLLAQFKTVAPKEFVREDRNRKVGIRILQIAAVVAAMGVLAALLLPSLAKSKSKSLSATYRLREMEIAQSRQAGVQALRPLPPMHEQTVNRSAAPISARRAFANSTSAPVILGNIPRPANTTIVLPPAENTKTVSATTLSGYSDTSMEWSPGTGIHQPKTAPAAPDLANANPQDVLPVLKDSFTSGKTSGISTGDNSPQNSLIYQRTQTVGVADGSVQQESVNGVTRSQTPSASFDSGAAGADFQVQGWTGNYANYAAATVGGNAGPKTAIRYANPSDISAALPQLGAKSEQRNGAGTVAGERKDRNIDPVTGSRFARLLEDGSLDTSFDPGPGVLVAPPQVEAKAKFAEITPDVQAENFTNAGTFTFDSGGTAPSLKAGAGSDYANPLGLFPGSASDSGVDTNTVAFNESPPPASRGGTLLGPRSVTLADGSVQQFTVNGLRTFADHTGDTNAYSRGIGLYDGSVQQESVNGWQGGTLLGPRENLSVETNKLPADSGADFGAWSLYADNYDNSGKINGSIIRQRYVNLALTTPPAQAAQSPEPVVRASEIDFPEVPADQLLDVYGRLTDRTILRSSNLPSPQITVQTGTDRTRSEAIHDLEGILASNGIAVVNVGGKFVKAVPAASTGARGVNGSIIRQGYVQLTDNAEAGRQSEPEKESKEIIPVRSLNAANAATNESSEGETLNVVGYVNVQVTNGFGLAGLANPLYSNGTTSTNIALANDNRTEAFNAATDEAVRRQPNPTGAFRRSRSSNSNDYVATNGVYLATTEMGNVTVSVDPETKRVRFITDSDTAVSVSNVIRQLDGNGASKPPNVLHYNSIKIEAETEYAKQEKLLKELKKLTPEELLKTLPAAAPDPILTQLLQDKTTAEAELAKLKNDFGEQNPDVLRTKKLLDEYKRDIDLRVKGIIQGIEIQVETKRAQAQNSEVKLAEARTNDIAIAEQKSPKAEGELAQLEKTEKLQADTPLPKPAADAPIPQPEVMTGDNAFSTFSLNIADVSFKLAAASLEKGQMPDPATIRSEEFINAFDYRDPEPAPGAPLGFAWERAQYPFAHNRDLLRFAVKTAAAGREAGRPMNIVLLLDKSGSMERADRVQIIHEALRVLATQLGPQDKLSVVTFARVARLWVDGLPGSQAGEVVEGLDKLTPEGGTNLEEAMRLAYETARRHYLAGGINCVVLLTDGAANLGNVDPAALNQKVEQHRKEGIALDCFGVGWEGYNDDLLEVLSRHGDGRYGFINTPEEAANGFAKQLAGALHVAAADVKVQVEFNPKRVTAYRQIGYAKHQLTNEQFRDNKVDAAEIGAAESGNALYVVEVNPNGEGPLATVRVRYKVPGTEDYPEHEWLVPYTGNAPPLEQASPAMRLAGAASAFSESLATSPFAGEVTSDQLLGLMRGVPETYGADERPKKLEWMIRQAKSLTGK